MEANAFWGVSSQAYTGGPGRRIDLCVCVYVCVDVDLFHLGSYYTHPN